MFTSRSTATTAVFSFPYDTFSQKDKMLLYAGDLYIIEIFIRAAKNLTLRRALKLCWYSLQYNLYSVADPKTSERGGSPIIMKYKLPRLWPFF